MKIYMLIAFSLVMILGTALNVGCGLVSGENCDSATVSIVEPGVYEVQSLQENGGYEGLVFPEGGQVEIERSFDGSTTNVVFNYDGVEQRWTTQSPE